VQGPAPALESYLNIDAIIDAVKKTGARAVSYLSRQMSSAGRRAAVAASYAAELA
jgi:acetyl/propionyl-CoA carboxylase alpha subunit